MEDRKVMIQGQREPQGNDHLCFVFVVLHALWDEPRFGAHQASTFPAPFSALQQTFSRFWSLTPKPCLHVTLGCISPKHRGKIFKKKKIIGKKQLPAVCLEGKEGNKEIPQLDSGPALGTPTHGSGGGSSLGQPLTY